MYVFGCGNQSSSTCALPLHVLERSAVPAAFTEKQNCIFAMHEPQHRHTHMAWIRYISSHNIFVMPLFVHLHRAVYVFACTVRTRDDDVCLSINLHFRCYIQHETLFKHKYTDQLRCTRRASATLPHQPLFIIFFCHDPNSNSGSGGGGSGKTFRQIIYDVQ